jgi:Spy/CpxP family protein refolding chaperone
MQQNPRKGVGEEMFLRKLWLGVIGLVLAGGLGTFAQEPQAQSPSTQDGALQRERTERRERLGEHFGSREGMERRRQMRRQRGMGRMMRELNLSDEQRQQSRAMMQRRLESMKGPREELFKLREKRIAGTFTADDEVRAKALRQEMRTAMEGARSEMSGVLNAEQKARIEQLKKERKERMEQRLKERQERLNNKPM